VLGIDCQPRRVHTGNASLVVGEEGINVPFYKLLRRYGAIAVYNGRSYKVRYARIIGGSRPQDAVGGGAHGRLLPAGQQGRGIPGVKYVKAYGALKIRLQRKGMGGATAAPGAAKAGCRVQLAFKGDLFL